MSPSQFAATNILPLLARIVLCLAFLPSGWNDLMVDGEFTGTDAQRLREMGVRGITDPDPAKADVALGAMRGEAWWAAQGDAPAQAAPATPAPTQPATAAPTAAKPAVPAAPAAAPAAANVSPSPVAVAAAARLSPMAPLTQRGVYWLALQADRARIPFPIEVAWAVAGVKFVGGVCMVLGLFSRVWGVLMATIVAALFVMTGMPVIKAGGARAFFHFTPDQSNMVFAQLGLFVLALGTFLVGPGALSLDRAIFRKSRRGGSKSS
jgi:uncharacterized membrane protein YphA (DoxX/SURF4 family)